MLAGNVRRSSRRVKPRGEREFLVNSDTLLRDLKVLVGFKIDHPRQTFDIVFRLWKRSKLHPTTRISWWMENISPRIISLSASWKCCQEVWYFWGWVTVQSAGKSYLHVNDFRRMNLQTAPRVPLRTMLDRITRRQASRGPAYSADDNHIPNCNYDRILSKLYFCFYSFECYIILVVQVQKIYNLMVMVFQIQ